MPLAQGKFVFISGYKSLFSSWPTRKKKSKNYTTASGSYRLCSM